MRTEKIRALMNSLHELERTIQYASEALGNIEPKPEQLIERIENYKEIITKQKEFASGLEDHLANGKYKEVARHAKLINGLTLMIYEDARALSALARNGRKPVLNANEKQLLC